MDCSLDDYIVKRGFRKPASMNQRIGVQQRAGTFSGQNNKITNVRNRLGVKGGMQTAPKIGIQRLSQSNFNQQPKKPIQPITFDASKPLLSSSNQSAGFDARQKLKTKTIQDARVKLAGGSSGPVDARAKLASKQNTLMDARQKLLLKKQGLVTAKQSNVISKPSAIAALKQLGVKGPGLQTQTAARMNTAQPRFSQKPGQQNQRGANAYVNLASSGAMMPQQQNLYGGNMVGAVPQQPLGYMPTTQLPYGTQQLGSLSQQQLYPQPLGLPQQQFAGLAAGQQLGYQTNQPFAQQLTGGLQYTTGLNEPQLNIRKTISGYVGNTVDLAGDTMRSYSDASISQMTGRHAQKRRSYGNDAQPIVTVVSRGAPPLKAVKREAEEIFASPLEGHKIMISNLLPSVSTDDILELFGAVGALKRCRLLKEGRAEVVFVDDEAVLRAIKKYHQRKLDGQPMHVVRVNDPKVEPSYTSRAAAASKSAVGARGGVSGDVEIDSDVLHRALFKTTQQKKEETRSGPVSFVVQM